MERRKSLGRRRSSVIPPARRKSSCIVDTISREMSTYASEFGEDYMGPMEWSEWIRTKVPSLGSVYLIPNPKCFYSYKLATDNEEARFSFHYLTLSPTGLNEFIGSKISYSSLDKWIDESLLYEKIRQIPFFMQFRISKLFRTWSKIVRKSKFNSVSKHLLEHSSLWGKNGALRLSLCKVMSLMSQLTDMGVTVLDSGKTYNIEDFYKIQEERVDVFSQDLIQFRSLLKRVVLDACKSTFTQHGFNLEDYWLEVKQISRQFSDSTTLSPDNHRFETPKKLTFIEQSNKKLLCERLVSFIHLVDWMFRLALHNCAKNSFDCILSEMESRSSQFIIEDDGGKKGASGISGTPMFHVTLSIEDRRIFVDPSLNDFEGILKKYFDKLNEALSSVQLIINDEDLSPFTRPYLYGKIEDFLSKFKGEVLISNHGSSILQVISTMLETLSKSYDACKLIFEPYSQTCKEFSASPSVSSTNSSEMAVSTDVEQLKGDMQSLTSQQKSIRELKDSLPIGLFKTDFRSFKRRLLPNISKAFSKLQEALPMLGRGKISALNKCIKEVGALADFEPESSHDMVQHMNTLSTLKTEYESLSDKYEDILKVFGIMEKIPLPIPPEESSAMNNLKASMSSLRTAIEKREQREGSKRERLRLLLVEEECSLKGVISEVLQDVRSPHLLEISSTPEEIRESLGKYRRELNGVFEKAQVYNGYEREFGFEVTIYEDIPEAQSLLSSIERLWDCVEDWESRIKVWYSAEFHSLDVEAAYDYTRDLVGELGRIREALGKENEVLSKLEEEVTGLKAKIPCIRDLRSGSLKQRHWNIISELLGVENHVEEMTLEYLDQYGAYSYAKDIRRITRSAVEEERLDNLIQELKDTWTKTRVETRVRHGVLIVHGFDFLFDTLESCFMTLRQLGKSRYVNQFADRLQSWSAKLEFVRVFVELLKSVQNLWAIQEVPFSCLMFKEELPGVHKYFQLTKSNFIRALNTVIEAPNILESFTNEDNFFILTDVKLHFNKLESHLFDTLRAIRFSSPRLFFLSEDQLLQVLEHSTSHISELNKYLPLMFTSIRSVIFEESDANIRAYNPYIIGVTSKEGERLIFDEPVKARLDAPHWIKTIDKDVYRFILLEFQDVMTKGISDVWTDPKFLAQSQSNALHVHMSRNKGLDLKAMTDHCLRVIQNPANPSIKLKEASKLIQLKFYEESEDFAMDYVYDNNRLQVNGYGCSIQYGTEYHGYSLPFTPELLHYCPSELFYEFGVSQNSAAQKLYAGLLGKFYFSYSHFDHDYNLHDILLGTLKLGSWTFFQDFDFVSEENALFLKEISVYYQMDKERPRRRKKTFLDLRGYEISIGLLPRLRMDSEKGGIGRSAISIIRPDFKLRLSLAFLKKGHIQFDVLIDNLVNISQKLEPFGHHQQEDFENKVLYALSAYDFKSKSDFANICIDRARVLDEISVLKDLDKLLNDTIWTEKLKVAQGIDAKMDSSFDVFVLNATELQSSVDNFTFTSLSCPESLAKQKILSLSLRYLENSGYSIIKLCPVTQALHSNLRSHISSIIQASQGRVVFLFNGLSTGYWRIYISKLLILHPSLKFILTDDVVQEHEIPSRRRIKLFYGEKQEYRLLLEKIDSSIKDYFDTCYDISERMSNFMMSELDEHVGVYSLLSFALHDLAQTGSNPAPNLYKTLFISGAFHVIVKKSIDRLYGFFRDQLGVDPGIDDIKDPFNASQLSLKFSFGVNDIQPVFYVPSREQTKVILFLKSCLEFKLNVLLCGKRGSGKSTAIRKALKYLNKDKFELLFINMSSIQSNELMEDYFVKEDAFLVNKLRECSHRTLVFILESFDVDKSKHGYFLRSLQERSRLLWDHVTKKMVPLQIDNLVTLVEVTLGPSSSGYQESVKKMNEYSRGLLSIHLRKDEKENEMITKTILDKFITDFEKDVSDSSHSIPPLINSIHESFKKHHPHQVSDHNLFRVLIGILYADPEIFVRGRDFGNHVYNEMRNEYIGYEAVTYDTQNIIDSKFSAKRDPNDVSSFKDSLSYFYLEEGLIKIKMISISEAEQKFNNAYSGIRGKTYNTRLVFSNPFTYLISNLIRSINKYGDILLYGKGGHGRRSCAEFVAFFLGIRLIEAPGSYESYLKQLKIAYIDASNGEVVLLLVKLRGMNQDTIKILRSVEEILYYGECHGLLNSDEMNEHLFDTDQKQYEANYNEETYKEARTALSESIREDLHFLICIEDPEVQSYVLNHHPYLTQRCGHHEIDYWNEETLRSIAEDRYSSIRLNNEKVSLSVTIRSLSIVSTQMHIQGLPLLQSNFSILNYLDAVRVFPNLYKPQFDDLMNEINEVSSGIAQISEANTMIHKLADEISGQEPESSRISTEIERLQKRISQEKTNLEKASKAFRKKELVARKRSQETKELVQDAHQSLERALPGLESAMAGLHAIDKNEVSEIRSFKNPPEAVQQVMEAVCILLGHKSDWNGAKSLLSDYSFLQRLIDFDKDNVPDAALKRIRRFVDNPKFIPEDIGKVSKAACTLCMWVRAIDLYATIFKAIEPKRIKLLQSESELVEAMTALRTETDRVAHIESSLSNLESSLTERIKKKESISENLKLTNIYLERAEHLSYSLEEECSRWKDQLQTAERKLKNLLGDSLLLSFIVGYCGKLPEELRNELLDLWKEILMQFNITCSENENELYGMSKNISQRWYEDEYFIQNALISKHTNKWPLYIDPNNIALQEALNLLSGQSTIASSDPDFGIKLRSALSEGCPSIISDFNFDFPPEFKNLFQRNLYEKVRVFVGLIGIPKMRKDVRVKLGSSAQHQEEVAVGSKFHMYLHSEDKSFHTFDDKINAISYELTQHSLFLKLRKELMIQMDKDFADKFDECVLTIERMSKEVNVKIRNVLLVFIKSKDSMLENDRLISSLKDAKASVFESANELNSLKNKFEDSLIPQLNQFSEFASKLTSFSILLKGFTKLKPFHLFSHKKILNTIQNGAVFQDDNIMPNEVIDLISREFIFELCPDQRMIFKRGIQWIKTLCSKDAEVFVRTNISRALQNNSLESDEDIRKAFNNFQDELQSCDELSECNIFNYISTLSENHPIILIDEWSSSSLDIVMDLLKHQRVKTLLKYLSLPTSHPPNPSRINDLLRMAKCEKNWVVIEGLGPLDLILSKLVIPRIEDNFRLFILGSHNVSLNSLKVLSTFKMICCTPPSPLEDLSSHTFFYRDRLQLWRKDVHRVDFFIRIYQWSLKDSAKTYPKNIQSHFQGIKLLIDKYDVPLSEDLDLNAISDFVSGIFKKSINLQKLREFID